MTAVPDLLAPWESREGKRVPSPPPANSALVQRSGQAPEEGIFTRRDVCRLVTCVTTADVRAR